MTAIQDWASSMCVLGIGCAVLKMLCPAGSMRRVFGVLTAVMFVCCLLSPITALLDGIEGVFALPDTPSPSYELSETVEEQAIAMIEQALLGDARERLQNTAQVKSVTVVRDITRLDSIYIKRVLVTIEHTTQALSETARGILRTAWGLEVEVNSNG